MIYTVSLFWKVQFYVLCSYQVTKLLSVAVYEEQKTMQMFHPTCQHISQQEIIIKIYLFCLIMKAMLWVNKGTSASFLLQELFQASKCRHSSSKSDRRLAELAIPIKSIDNNKDFSCKYCQSSSFSSKNPYRKVEIPASLPYPSVMVPLLS